MKTYLKIHKDDNVAVALSPLKEGTKVIIDDQEITLKEYIPQGHKFALTDINKETPVIKYGAQIGLAKEAIQTGSWIHTHNLKTGLGDLLTYSYTKNITPLEPSESLCFDGYRRSNGKVGVRNEIWIIPTVGCVNNVATAIEKQAQQYKTGNIDDIVAFPHPYGCSQMGDDQENTRQILADLVNHPNAGGVLVLGLGCENSNIDELKKHIGDYDEQRVRFLVAQESEDEIADALKIIKELAQKHLQITLAISLHSPNDEMRRGLMPIAMKYSIDELLDACHYYFKETNRRMTFEYSLVAGVNDQPVHAEELAGRLKGFPCHVNLIPVNPIKERDFKQSMPKSVMEFKKILEKNRVNVTIRREMGADINAACGQLRRKKLQSRL